MELAVERLGSVLPAPIQLPRHDRTSVLTPPDVEPQVYDPFQPDGCDGVVCDPDQDEKARQLLLFRSQAVGSANKSVWTEAHALLRRVLGHVRNPQARKACRIAALLVDEILHPDAGRDRRDINQRILAIEVGRRAAGELAADERLMQVLHEAVAATARPNSWSPISAVSAALEHADPDWTPARWGYLSDIKLIAATKQFAIRSLPRKGQQVIEVRARRRIADRR
ncbi:hypothetical protein [Nocardia wallacei]|uniref:hypothetical protein n=1 Tax=Nocardia wallacei TaxID=480035 RepID=UPI00245502BC|nr:hypothetical protein [Nocardia wallacei]